jgi:hypothetical protein
MGTELYPKFLSLAANWPEFWTQLGPQFDLADCEEDLPQFHVPLTHLEPKALNFRDLARHTKNI